MPRSDASRYFYYFLTKRGLLRHIAARPPRASLVRVRTSSLPLLVVRDGDTAVAHASSSPILLAIPNLVVTLLIRVTGKFVLKKSLTLDGALPVDVFALALPYGVVSVAMRKGTAVYFSSSGYVVLARNGDAYEVTASADYEATVLAYADEATSPPTVAGARVLLAGNFSGRAVAVLELKRNERAFITYRTRDGTLAAMFEDRQGKLKLKKMRV